MLYFWNMTGSILGSDSVERLDRALAVLQANELPETVLTVEGYNPPSFKLVPLRVRMTRAGVVTLA